MVANVLREKINKLPLPLQYAVGGSLALLLFLGLNFRLCMPLWTERAAVLARYQQERARLAQVEQFVKSHPDGETYVREVAAQTARADALLPDAAAMPSFLASVEATAHKSGVHLAAIKPQTPQPQQGYSRLPVEITVQGSYGDILGLLSGLQDLPRYTTVTRLEIHAPRLGASQLEAKIMAEIYATAPQAENQPGIAAPPSPPLPPPMPPRH